MKKIIIDSAPSDPVIAFGDGFPAGFFRHQLEKKFVESFVVANFEYKRIVLDYSVIVKDRLIEVAHVTSKQEYATIARAGKISLDKHKAIRAGTFISNAFYFLSPVRVLGLDEIPPKYGLITYNAAGDINIRKEADWIKPDMYLTKSFYCTLAKNLTKQLYK
jgi:hypothetical protein